MQHRKSRSILEGTAVTRAVNNLLQYTGSFVALVHDTKSITTRDTPTSNTNKGDSGDKANSKQLMHDRRSFREKK